MARAAKAPRATPFGLARLPYICHSETYKKSSVRHEVPKVAVMVDVSIRPINPIFTAGEIHVVKVATFERRQSDVRATFPRRAIGAEAIPLEAAH